MPSMCRQRKRLFVNPLYKFSIGTGRVGENISLPNANFRVFWESITYNSLIRGGAGGVILVYALLQKCYSYWYEAKTIVIGCILN